MRKKLQISTFLAMLCFIGAKSQSTSNCTVFSENGEKFKLTVDGTLANETFQTNVQVTGLEGDMHRFSVQFEESTRGSVNQNLFLEPDLAYKVLVKLKKNGQYALRPFGEPVAISKVQDQPRQELPVYSSAPEPAVAKTSSTEPSTTVVTTTTTTSGTPNGEGVSIKVNFDETNMGMDVNINDQMGDMETTTTVKTTETRSRQTQTVAEETTYMEEDPARDRIVKSCEAMAGGDFADATKTIASKSFEDSKMTTAKQILKGNCVNTDQITKLMGLFTYEESKLELAKIAHEKCTDTQNYWKLNDAFTFESSIDELNEFLETK